MLYLRKGRFCVDKKASRHKSPINKDPIKKTYNKE